VGEFALEARNRTVNLGVFVNLVAAPAPTPAVEHAHQPIRIGIAMSQESAEVVGDSRNRPAGEIREAVRAYCFYLESQLIADAFVGIQAKHPVIGRCLDREVLL